MIHREVERQFPNLRRFDLRSVDVFIFHSDPDDFAESLNVVVVKGTVPVSESQREKTADAIQEEYRSLGISPQEFSSRVARFAERDCFVFSYTAVFVGQEVRQTQYMVPGIDVTYVVTGSCKVADQGRFEPIFNKAMESFEVTGRGLSVWASLPRSVQWALVGGGLGLVLAVMMRILRMGRTTSIAP